MAKNEEGYLFWENIPFIQGDNKFSVFRAAAPWYDDLLEKELSKPVPSEWIEASKAFFSMGEDFPDTTVQRIITTLLFSKQNAPVFGSQLTQQLTAQDKRLKNMVTSRSPLSNKQKEHIANSLYFAAGKYYSLLCRIEFPKRSSLGMFFSPSICSSVPSPKGIVYVQSAMCCNFSGIFTSHSLDRVVERLLPEEATASLTSPRQWIMDYINAIFLVKEAETALYLYGENCFLVTKGFMFLGVIVANAILLFKTGISEDMYNSFQQKLALGEIEGAVKVWEWRKPRVSKSKVAAGNTPLISLASS